MVVIARQLAVAGAAVLAWAQPAIVSFGGPSTQVALFANFTAGLDPAAAFWLQPVRAPPLNPLGVRAAASLTPLAGPAITATLPAPGTYQFRVTVRNGPENVTADAWVQVWDARGSMSAGLPLGTGPAVNPPTSVRVLSRNPPAFEHPRLFFTVQDWPEISSRAASGRVARWGATTMSSWVANSIDRNTSAIGQAAAALTAWAAGNFTGTPPNVSTTLAADGILVSEASGSFFSMVLSAASVLWLQNDPRIAPTPAAAARGAYLSTLLSAGARIYISQNFDTSNGSVVINQRNPITNATNPLAITGLAVIGEQTTSPAISEIATAYDLLYNYMTDEQRRPVRNLMYAASWGRHQAPAGYVTSNTPNRGRPRRAIDMNGDFTNMNEQMILPSLAIEGEESAVDPVIANFFGRAANNSAQARWVAMANSTDPAAWPLATVASVDAIEREIAWLVQWFTTPWGLVATHLAYYGLTGKYLFPTMFAFARRGENLFITTHMYQTCLHALQAIHPSEGLITSSAGLGNTTLGFYDHHDSGGFGQRGTVPIMLKYMYPDDPLVDYVWRAYLPTMNRDPWHAAFWGIDPHRFWRCAKRSESQAESQAG